MNSSSTWGGAEAYERLRSHVLGGPPPEVWLLRTLDVFLQNGLAIWMIFESPSALSSVEIMPGHSCLVAQRELVFILADIIEPLLLS
jgi:hypothetical protein